MRFTLHYLAASAALILIHPPASAQLGDALRRVRDQAREVQQAVKDVDDTVDEVNAAVEDVGEAVGDAAGAATTEPSVPSPLPPAAPSAQGALAEAQRLAADCEQRASADPNFRACAKMCTDVSKSITPTTAASDAQAVLRLCTNAYSANFPAPTPAVVAAPAPTSAASSPVGTSESDKTAAAKYTAEIDALVPRCDAITEAQARSRCQVYCSGYRDAMHNTAATTPVQVAQQNVQQCRMLVEGTWQPAAQAVPTAEQVQREQQQQAQQDELKRVEAKAAAATAADYRGLVQYCEGLPGSNVYKNTCVLSCQQAAAAPSTATGVMCINQYEQAGGPK